MPLADKPAATTIERIMSQRTLLRAELPTIAEIRSAAELIYQSMPATPQYCWPLLGERLGAEVWLKHENQTPTGAFKARTAVVYVDELMKREPTTRGLIAATRGNHGQSVALAAKRFGISATIVVPYGNSREKNAAMRAQGGTLIECGADYQAAREKALELAAQHRLHMVQPYHYDIVRGVATYWLELLSAVKDIDVAYVPIGMGSGICSAVAVRNGLGLRTKVVGVVSAHAPSYAESFEQRKVIEVPATTRLADGMACRKPDEQALAILLENVDHIVRVTDEEVADAMRHIFTDTHNVVEGAGAAGLAAALKEKDQLQGKRVALVATGANVDSDVFARVLQGQSG
jgi:threonine dehydratase